MTGVARRRVANFLQSLVVKNCKKKMVKKFLATPKATPLLKVSSPLSIFQTQWILVGATINSN